MFASITRHKRRSGDRRDAALITRPLATACYLTGGRRKQGTKVGPALFVFVVFIFIGFSVIISAAFGFVHNVSLFLHISRTHLMIRSSPPLRVHKFYRQDCSCSTPSNNSRSVAAVSRHGRVLWLNPARQRIFGMAQVRDEGVLQTSVASRLTSLRLPCGTGSGY